LKLIVHEYIFLRFVF